MSSVFRGSQDSCRRGDLDLQMYSCMIATPSRAPLYKSTSFTTFTFSATAKASLLNARVLEGGGLPPRRLQSHEPPKDLLPPIAHATAADGSQGVSASVLARTLLVHAVSVSQGLSGAWSMVRLFLAIYIRFCICSHRIGGMSVHLYIRSPTPEHGHDCALCFRVKMEHTVTEFNEEYRSLPTRLHVGLLAAPPQEKHWLFLKRGHVCFVFCPRRTVGSHQIDFCGHLGVQLSGVLIGVASTVNRRLAGHGINRYLGSPMQSCVVVWNDTVAGCYASTECPHRGEGARGLSRTTVPAGSHIGGIFQIIVIKTARCEAGPVILPERASSSLRMRVMPPRITDFRHEKSRYGRKLRQEVRRLLACAYDSPNTNGLAKPMLYIPAVCVATSWSVGPLAERLVELYRYQIRDKRLGRRAFNHADSNFNLARLLDMADKELDCQTPVQAAREAHKGSVAKLLLRQQCIGSRRASCDDPQTLESTQQLCLRREQQAASLLAPSWFSYRGPYPLRSPTVIAKMMLPPFTAIAK
ncbi:uncharacterized protein SCHCODRAFT_0236085 [Schizophyllum commune H4-8]|uniref:Uncharacterized protein n=1 Tax=Schizophyllum commune (strain H4-8 / FGSC 9210) TaxID=578458 RepID=D8Q9U7_SCHCM|nr:uncharacterized protein SCHCODRAFT_0236085 [Schizophyllum commune H4-8]KAI5890277.1 hypothetical protein SCHCODRAFT_0236085 [Schizophyllum commune H4-8]